MGTIENPLNNSKGCGGIMRIAPCGLLYSPSDNAGYIASECAAITHGHALSHMSSYICAAIISMITYEDMTIDQAITEAIRLVSEHHERFNDKDNSLQALTCLNKAIDLSKQNLSDPQAIKEIGEGWHADDALAIALYACLKYPNSFEDAIVCAANHDGDSDSTAAIAGNILGAYLGIDAIPQYYIYNVELKDTILEIADDLCEIVINDDIAKNTEWIKKYS
jgi:ADP-ribosylglycohydrolase